MYYRVTFEGFIQFIAISKLLFACSLATALHSDINQTAGLGGHLSMRENQCMHASVSAACRPAEMGQRRSEIRLVHRSIHVGRICPFDVKG